MSSSEVVLETKAQQGLNSSVVPSDIEGLAESRSRGSQRFDRTPLLVFWETTKACPLSCQHCRAQAIANALPGELSTDEGKDLIRQITGFENPSPILVLSGGDVLMRPDALELVAFARSKKVRVAISPTVSDCLNDQLIGELYGLGVRSVSISLDGIGDRHDHIRGVAGHFEQSVDAIRRLVAAGFSVQVNTTVMSITVGDLAAVVELLISLGVRIWEVFFLIQVGRGKALGELSPAENEDVARFLYLASSYGLLVRTVEGPFFRRVAVNIKNPSLGTRDILPPGDLYNSLEADLTSRLGGPTSLPRLPATATRDGKGIIFVAHDGNVFPSGFLEISLGNVRLTPLAEIYRDHPLLRAIRSGSFTGRCGDCRYKDLCGGSRSRAFAHFGDPLAEDPGCSYHPPESVNDSYRSEALTL